MLGDGFFLLRPEDRGGAKGKKLLRERELGTR